MGLDCCFFVDTRGEPNRKKKFNSELVVYSYIPNTCTLITGNPVRKLFKLYLSGHFSVGWMRVVVKVQALKVSLAEILLRCEMR